MAYNNISDMFVVYNTLPKKKKEEKTTIQKPGRYNYLWDLIPRVFSIVKKEQKETKETKETPQTTIVESEYIFQPEQSKQETKYSRMVSRVDDKSPIKTVMNYFINKGLTPEQASGFVGNFLSESELNTSAVNQDERKKGYKGYGRGIAQWSNERVQQFKDYTGKNVEDASLNEQLDFVWYELQSRPELMKQLQLASTSDEATDLVYRGYENGSSAGLATPEQLTQSYGKAWRKLGYREYNFQKDLQNRQKRAKQALINYLS